MTLAFREVEPRPHSDAAPPVILIIDDDRLSRDALAATLSVEGFDVITAGGGEEGVAQLATVTPALVILDTRIGGSDGFALFRSITSTHPALPVILLTEEQDELDAVLALEAGAADHVTKPARPRELTARIRAVLRRVVGDATPRDPDTPTGAYVFGPVVVDVARREAQLDGRDLELSRKEFDLLALLVSQGGHVVTRAQCMERIWGETRKGESRTLDTHVKRLRKKIEANPAEPVHLITVRGVGYRFKP